MNSTRQRPTLLFEMFDLIERQKTPQDRIAMLGYLKCYELSSILQINFRFDVKLDLPPGPIAFQRDNGDPDQSLSRTQNVIGDFKELDVRNKVLTTRQKLAKFIGMLESVNEREAEVFLLAKGKKLQAKWAWLTTEMVRQAIPGII